MLSLPVEQVIPDIKQQLQEHNRLVLQAPPGAGKTTAVPLALLQEPWLQNKSIIMLEPRRLAARNAAARMAAMLNEEVGATVGYQIRDDRCYSASTRILIVTEGILTRKLQADPELLDVNLIIFDEFHERNLQADLALALSLQTQEVLRPSLKVLVMSATLDGLAVAKLLQDAAIIQSEGRSFPVTTQYLAPQTPWLDRYSVMPYLLTAINDALSQYTGDILVFLPGTGEIKQLHQRLQQHDAVQAYKNLRIAPLYGDLSKAQQDEAIQASPSGQRKIVLATNIAETSLTIEGVRIVIDAGLQRELQFNVRSAMNRLQTVRVSQASAEQRRGRAGRLAAGHCYRMWTEAQQQQLAAYTAAEILNSDLTPLMLELAQWGVRDVNELHWQDLPPTASIAQASELLSALGAVDKAGRITAHGQAMLAFGTHPRLAHMLLKASTLGCAYDACLIAAVLTERDIFVRGTDRSASRSADISARAAALFEMANNNVANNTSNSVRVDKAQAKRVRQLAEVFWRQLNLKQSKPTSLQEEMHGVLLGLAYPDRIAQLRNARDKRYLLSSGKGACFQYDDALATCDYLVVADLDGQQRDANIYLAASIALTQLQTHFAEHIQHKTQLRWLDAAERVDAVAQQSLGALVLAESHVTEIDQESIFDVLLSEIKNQGLTCLSWSKSALLLKQRVMFLSQHKENNPQGCLSQSKLPNMDDDYLLANLDQWLRPHLTQENSIKKLQNLDMHMILLAMLSWEQQQLLEQYAPTHLQVPSGSRVAIDYEDADTPVLAVRLQEMFGQQTTPTIVNGEHVLLIHLLSPANRPMQMTRDLPSFWQNTYFDIKKELQGKYKKHYWPDDPLTAQATSRTKRKM